MPYILPVIGTIIFAACAGMLIFPLFSWRFKYKAAETTVTVDIPKAGRYVFYIRRYRSWGGYGSKNRVNFSIAIFDAKDETYLVSAHSMKTTSGAGVGPEKIKVAHFNAPHPGSYKIVSLPDNQFASKDVIVIKKYINNIRYIIPILGVAISPHMITSGIAGGLVSLGGIILGAVVVGLNW